ncbi:MAG TPA: BTAD domain-containing putative transcriptional regulator [Pyrinomonadaceae bacterium]|nr:BTAD domain-containing putative transcriptional regulator [Pyrinomonadaceae bacterium]
MQDKNFFLRTKLLPPRAVSELLDRPRLTKKLQANIGSLVTLVAADAGCGKTTLIADFVRNQSRPSVWYQLDHTDADPVVFLGYVAHGIRNLYPEFGEAIFPYLSEANEEVLRFPERAADLLINEILQSVEQPFILVLDDYHHIGRDTVVHKMVDRLLQYSSDLVHLVITTRDLPPLAIMRRRSQSAALVITRDDLLFTDDEVRELFRKTLNVELKAEEIAEYCGRTHGWITALQLVRQVAEQEMHTASDAKPLDLRNVLQQSEKDIFDYFAEEVFSRESDETRSLLMHLALLESLQLDLCSALFPDLRCSAALPELAQKNVFLTVVGDGQSNEEYRFHPLFREFLVRRFRAQVGQARVAEERDRIGEYFLANKKWEMALPYLLDARSFDRAAAVIAETGGEWIAAGAFTSLGLFADKVPDENLEKFPRSVLHKAEIARLQGESEKSSTLLHTAVRLLHEADDATGEAEALHSLASLARRRGRHAEAFKLLERAEALVPQASETFLKCANTRGLCLIVQGSWAEAEQQFRVALELAEKLANEPYIRMVTHNLALAPGFRGDFGEALRWFKRIFREDRPDKQLPQEAIGHLNVSRLHLYRGEFEETEKHLNRSLELCQLYNLRSLRGEIFEAYGNFYREKNDFAHAEEFYERALNAYDEAEIDAASKELNEERAIFYRLRGENAKARHLLESLIRSRESHGNELGTNTAKLRLFQVDLAEGKLDGLEQKISEVLEFFTRQNHYYDEALAAMLLAETYLARGEHLQMIESARRALDLSARFDYEYWLRREIRRNPGIFGHEEIFERLPADLREELSVDRSIPPTSKEIPLSVPATAITDLTVKVLGPVEIFRDPAKPFAGDAWTTRRARDIFCYIATSKHRRVPKDVLIEAFWPDQDMAAVEKNFHPTISHIRKALNSKQALKQNFVVFRDGAYQLNPELSYAIDSEEFEHAVAEAEKAKREKDTEKFRASLEAAYRLYRGDFMAGIYEGWADERRQFYSEQAGRVISALAKLSLSERRWADALKFGAEALRDDPFREDMHRLTMKALAAQGKPAAVKKHFEGMKKTLADELGIEPSAETNKLFGELVSAS